MEDEVSLKRRVENFKKALSQNEVLQEFDRGIFESIIEKVIVGGYDEDGNKDPYKITFIYKTGFRNEVRNAKERFDKAKSVGDKAKELCSHIADEVKDVCSYISDNTCGDNSCTTSDRFIRILDFRHFERFFRFDQSDRKTYKKAISDGVNVSVVLDSVCGNTSKLK